MAPISKQTISISTGTIVKSIGILVFLGFLWIVRDIVLVVLFSLIIASTIDPIVDRLQKSKIPRAVSVLGIYVLLIVVVAGVITLLVPPIMTEVGELARQLPEYFATEGIDLFAQFQGIATQLDLTDSARNLFTSIGSTLSSTTGGIFSTVGSFVAGVFSVAAVAALTFYLTVEERGVKKFFEFMVPKNRRAYVNDVVSRIQSKLGAWLRSYLILSLLVGVMIYLGLVILGVKYALVLALFAALLEFIPYIGPSVAAIPAAFFAATQSPLLAGFVILLYIAVNQLEGNFIVPKIMQKNIGLSPVLVIIVLLVGGKLAGIVGLLLAVPLTIVLAELGKDIFESRKIGSRGLNS